MSLATLPAPLAGATPVHVRAADHTASWPDGARGLLTDLAVAALAATALAQRHGDTGPWRSSRRVRALADHLGDTCAQLRHDLLLQTQVVLPVLRTAPLGLRTAVVRSSVERVLRELADVERGTDLLATGRASAADLHDLALALRSTRAAVSLHRRLWSSEAIPVARELLRERAALG